MDENESIEEINKKASGTLTHFSTWVLVKDQALISQIKAFIKMSDVSIPLRLRLRVFGDEAEFLTFSSLTIDNLITQLTERTGLEAETFKVKALEESRIRRIDNKLRDKTRNN